MPETLTHHMVYGTLTDYLTGEELTDTDDERIRQELARMMVEDKGWNREELTPRRFIETLFSSQFVRSTIELCASLDDRTVLVIRYGPGSMVSRERSAIAAARVLETDYRIPLAVVTNGQDAELLDTNSGTVLKTGMKAIPTRQEALALLPDLVFAEPPKDKRREGEMRILNAFDVEICCRK
ncbi:MAG: type I restriction enzyme HsdR N-terminal domain-containing protein [Desulfobulbaceae bacterium]|uniref:Type I restriction enzyme HsdR N-terminal domain-containing protein n=1 Tax=Candidatus Desulfatifera sulfidica TaxID=2841691 RepID=A0A8J6T9Z6_9BACT|nr:type I restriction enzyme HsdR N-terminal domain-containing protein [Candidatus Desulfatifera sulfidica]